MGSITEALNKATKVALDTNCIIKKGLYNKPSTINCYLFL
jgi:hypothetical protein